MSADYVENLVFITVHSQLHSQCAVSLFKVPRLKSDRNQIYQYIKETTKIQQNDELEQFSYLLLSADQEGVQTISAKTPNQELERARVLHEP